MIDPLFKSLEVLRQVYPEGLFMLVAPEDYDKNKQWVFILNDTKSREVKAGFSPLADYRFFKVSDDTGYAFITGQEALTFARETDTFNMRRFTEQIKYKLIFLHNQNQKANQLIESAYPEETIDDLYRDATQSALIRSRLVVKKLEDMTGIPINMKPKFNLVKDDDT